MGLATQVLRIPQALKEPALQSASPPRTQSQRAVPGQPNAVRKKKHRAIWKPGWSRKASLGRWHLSRDLRDNMECGCAIPGDASGGPGQEKQSPSRAGKALRAQWPRCKKPLGQPLWKSPSRVLPVAGRGEWMLGGRRQSQSPVREGQSGRRAWDKQEVVLGGCVVRGFMHWHCGLGMGSVHARRGSV